MGEFLLGVVMEFTAVPSSLQGWNRERKDDWEGDKGRRVKGRHKAKRGNYVKSEH